MLISRKNFLIKKIKKSRFLPELNCGNNKQHDWGVIIPQSELFAMKNY